MPPQRILLVDDNTALLNALTRLLRSSQYEIHKANSASQAWEVLATLDGNVNMIIADNQMPGERGVDFLKSVKHHYPRIVRIMLTGKSNLTDAQSCVNEADVFRFFTKPWDADELKASIAEGLRLGSKAPSASTRSPSGSSGLALNELEQEHPGISRVRRDSDGCFVLASRFPDLPSR